jgi:hypothetical protein
MRSTSTEYARVNEAYTQLEALPKSRRSVQRCYTSIFISIWHSLASVLPHARPNQRQRRHSNCTTCLYSINPWRSDQHSRIRRLTTASNLPIDCFELLFNAGRCILRLGRSRLVCRANWTMLRAGGWSRLSRRRVYFHCRVLHRLGCVDGVTHFR